MSILRHSLEVDHIDSMTDLILIMREYSYELASSQCGRKRFMEAIYIIYDTIQLTLFEVLSPFF